MKKLSLVLALLCSLFAFARAQTPATTTTTPPTTTPPPPQKDSDGFEKVSGDEIKQPGEFIPADRLIAAAYGFIFVALLVYVVSVAIRTRRVEEELDALKRKLDEGA